MAMNKKEQAEVEALRNRIALLEGMTLPPVLKPRPLEPVERGTLHGWTCSPHNAIDRYAGKARRAVAELWRRNDINYHDAGLTNGHRGEVTLYATRQEALLAMYYEVQEKLGSVLADIRDEILKEQDNV